MKKGLTKQTLRQTVKLSIFTVTLGTLFFTYSASSMKAGGLGGSRSVKTPSYHLSALEQEPSDSKEITIKEGIESDNYITLKNAPKAFTYGDRVVTGEVIDGITYYSISDIVDTFNFTYAPSTDSEYIYSIYTGAKEVPLRFPYYLLKDGEKYLPYRLLVDQLGIQFVKDAAGCKAVLTATKDESCYKEQHLFGYNKINKCELFGKDGTIAINTLQCTDLEQLYTICINDKVFIDGLAFNLSNRFAIIEVGGKVVIAISDFGISDDYTTTLYLYDNDNLQTLGMVGGLIDGGMVLKEGFTFDKEGYFYSEERMSLLHTGWYLKQHRVNVASGILEDMTINYYKIQGKVVLLRDFNFYTTRAGKEKVTLKAGTSLLLTATDNKAWVSVRPEKDLTKEYWMTFTENSNFYLLDDGTGEGCSPESVFDGLFFAD